MTVAIVTQARMTSTRLPGKVLIEVGGTTLLEHHLARLRASGLPVIVATTTNVDDDPIAALATERGHAVVRGSETDVLSRYADAIRAHGLTTVVRVTSDCPLIDGGLVRRGVDRYLEDPDPWRYVSNTLERTWPRGLDFEVFSAEALLDADATTDDPVDREHVTPFLYRGGSGRMTLDGIAREPASPPYRITLDTEADLEVITRLIEDHDALDLDAEGLIALLDAHPEIAAINADIEQKKLGE